jgi:hypothetical protein
VKDQGAAATLMSIEQNATHRTHPKGRKGNGLFMNQGLRDPGAAFQSVWRQSTDGKP